jgi:hypothetical protein
MKYRQSSTNETAVASGDDSLPGFVRRKTSAKLLRTTTGVCLCLNL